MTNKEFKELINSTICGYTFGELVVFADACRKQDISNDNLKEFCENARNAYNYGFSEITKGFERELSRQLGQRKEE